MTSRIEQLKREAVEATRAGDYQRQGQILQELEDIWMDDRAAMAFYTELEAL